MENIENLIHVIRGKQVMLDRDLARLYGVETRVLNQAVQRNIERFPEDFMFQLSLKEMRETSENKGVADLTSQIVISNKRGGQRYMPYAFTETGVAMLSSVLRSQQAININIQIMRAKGVTADIYSDSEYKTLRDSHNASKGKQPVNTHKWSKSSHDRWVIIDDTLYHCGHSVKDLGKKLSAIMKMDWNPEVVLKEVR